MLLKGVMRKKPAAKMWGWAAAWQGESPEACRARREQWTLTYLAGDVSPASLCGVRWAHAAPWRLHRMVAHGAPGHPDSPLEEDGGAPKRVAGNRM